MVDLIFSYVIKTILIIISCVLYIFLVSKVFPALFLSVDRKKESATDRGIKRFTFQNGRAIVYVPDIETKKYITQYILSENNGERFLKCKFDNRVVTALYKIAVFDSSDKIIDTIKVYDTPDCKEIARAVPLPLSAAYVKIAVIEINRKNVSARKEPSISLISKVLFAALTLAATVEISLIFHAAVTHIADLAFDYSNKFGKLGIGFPILSALIIATPYILSTIKKFRSAD